MVVQSDDSKLIKMSKETSKKHDDLPKFVCRCQSYQPQGNQEPGQVVVTTPVPSPAAAVQQ